MTKVGEVTLADLVGKRVRLSAEDCCLRVDMVGIVKSAQIVEDWPDHEFKFRDGNYVLVTKNDDVELL